MPDDVKRMAEPVLAHRLIPSAQTRLRRQATSELVANLLRRVPVPVEEVWSPA